MRLKNYQEDLVLHIIRIALEERPEIQADEAFIHDVAAYTLNRIPPKYIHTERGFTRLACSDLSESTEGEGMANLVQVLLTVNRAIDIVRNRREGMPLPVGLPTAAAAGSGADGLPSLGEMEYWHNFPCILGQVVDVRDDSPLSGVTVTAYLDGSAVCSADPGWQNPYLTLPVTRGYYNFLPRPLKSRAEQGRHTLTLSFEHPMYRSLRTEHPLQTRGDFEPRTAIGSDDIVNLSVTRLSPLD